MSTLHLDGEWSTAFQELEELQELQVELQAELHNARIAQEQEIEEKSLGKWLAETCGAGLAEGGEAFRALYESRFKDYEIHDFNQLKSMAPDAVQVVLDQVVPPEMAEHRELIKGPMEAIWAAERAEVERRERIRAEEEEAARVRAEEEAARVRAEEEAEAQERARLEEEARVAQELADAAAAARREQDAQERARLEEEARVAQELADVAAAARREQEAQERARLAAYSSDSQLTAAKFFGNIPDDVALAIACALGACPLDLLRLTMTCRCFTRSVVNEAARRWLAVQPEAAQRRVPRRATDCWLGLVHELRELRLSARLSRATPGITLLAGGSVARNHTGSFWGGRFEVAASKVVMRAGRHRAHFSMRPTTTKTDNDEAKMFGVIRPASDVQGEGQFAQDVLMDAWADHCFYSTCPLRIIHNYAA